MGAKAYTLLKQHSDVGPDECVLEIGSERGEGSTQWLAAYCDKRSIVFHTVDIDPIIYDGACKLLSRYRTAQAHLARGEDFLACHFEGCIRFAYLDNFDCVPRGLSKSDFMKPFRKRYIELGLRLTNEMSAMTHLIQAALVEIYAASRCAVLIDDTEKGKRRWLGKGALAVPYLESRGFSVSDVGGAALAVRVESA